jgi:hypothetical protein
MATVEQLQDLSHYIETLPQSERELLSVDEIYARWREQAFRDEDFQAVKEAVDSFKNGNRGRPFNEFIAEIKAKRQDDELNK